MRKPLSMNGEHAFVRQLPKSEKRGIFRSKYKRRAIVERMAHEPSSNKYYGTAMSLANLLFPGNFPKLVASSAGKRLNGEPVSVYSTKTYTTPDMEGRIKEFFRIHPAWVARGRNAEELYSIFPEYFRHENEIERLLEKFSASGLVVSNHPVNIAFTAKGRPVFYEVIRVNLPVLESFVRAMPEQTPTQKLRKKQALLLLDTMEKSRETVLSVHR